VTTRLCNETGGCDIYGDMILFRLSWQSAASFHSLDTWEHPPHPHIRSQEREKEDWLGDKTRASACAPSNLLLTDSICNYV
jgi:hypothetical protein